MRYIRGRAKRAATALILELPLNAPTRLDKRAITTVIPHSQRTGTIDPKPFARPPPGGALSDRVSQKEIQRRLQCTQRRRRCLQRATSTAALDIRAPYFGAIVRPRIMRKHACDRGLRDDETNDTDSAAICARFTAPLSIFPSRSRRDVQQRIALSAHAANSEPRFYLSVQSVQHQASGIATRLVGQPLREARTLFNESYNLNDAAVSASQQGSEDIPGRIVRRRRIIWESVPTMSTQISTVKCATQDK
jgi:hypothetical protein